MKKLNFTLYETDNIVLCETCEYKQVDNGITFRLQEDVFIIITKGEYFLLKKENKESVFKLIKNKTVIKCTLELKNNNASFDIKCPKFEYNFSENHITVTYILETELKSLKKIEIKY